MRPFPLSYGNSYKRWRFPLHQQSISGGRQPTCKSFLSFFTFSFTLFLVVFLFLSQVYHKKNKIEKKKNQKTRKRGKHVQQVSVQRRNKRSNAPRKIQNLVERCTTFVSNRRRKRFAIRVYILKVMVVSTRRICAGLICVVTNFRRDLP